jgi:general secretion pathway protein F
MLSLLRPNRVTPGFLFASLPPPAKGVGALPPMPSFTFTARDSAGSTVTDRVEAGSRAEAVRRLQARGLRPVRLQEQGASVPTASSGLPAWLTRLGADSERKRAAGLTRAQRLPFLESLHDLTSSGLSASEAVRLLATRVQEPRLRTLCALLWERLSEGSPLSQAMVASPEVFDESTANLMQAGEATGNLSDTLARLIEHHTAQRDLRQQIVTALSYPILIMVVAGGVVLFFLYFLLPRLQSLFDALGGELPFATRLLVGSADLLLSYGWLGLGLMAFGALTFWRWRATSAGRLTSDAWLLRTPLAGGFARDRTGLAFGQTLSVLLENGITTAEALRMTARQIDNRVHRAAFDAAIDRILEGESLAAALRPTGCFPDLVLDQLAVGENTGNVVPALKKIAADYRRRVAARLHRFTRVLASGVLIAVFVFVGFLAYAIVTAVLTLSHSFQM